jgi:hypothetical protein
MSQDNLPTPPRQSRMPIILSLFALAGALLFLILISGGFFLYVLLGVGLIALVGLLHYALWGAVLHERTEGEREEERLRQEAEADPW